MPIRLLKYKDLYKVITLFLFFFLFIYGISLQYIKPAYSWYNSSWMYKNPITITNTGSELTNEDILVTLDTATLIDGSRLKSACEDLRFVDSNDTSLLDFWLESECDSTTTKIWVRVPTVPNGGKTIYVYYGNTSATSTALTWSGNIMLYADDTCPSGWTRASQFDNKFMYGSDTYGTTGGTDSHSHGTASGTSDSLSGTAVSGISGTTTGASSTHTHTTLQATVNTPSAIVPSYLDMIVCYKNDFLIPNGLISMFDVASLPLGWVRFSSLDSKFPRGASSYGGSGGSDTHNHTLTTGVTTGAASATQGALVPVSASGGTESTVSGYKIHKFTSSSTLSVTTGGNVEVLVVAGGGGGGMTAYASQSQGGFGGGGAGGHVYDSSYALTTGSITVTRGAAGATNAAGGNSVFATITATGGAGGDGNAGNAGGCGSGGSNGGGGGTGSQGGNGGACVCSICGNATAGGGGGGGGGNGSNSWDYNGGAGGNGVNYSIIAAAGAGVGGYVAGGGGGGGWSEGGGGGTGGGGGGADNDPEAPGAGTANTGGGGGGGVEAGFNGAAGGSGLILVRYIATASGTVASSTHTHTSTGGSVNTISNLPPYLSVIYAKQDHLDPKYITEDNILMASSLPPLGWSRFTSLDSKFARGSDTYGGTGGATTHTHDVTISTGAPSATADYYGNAGNSFASNSHTHSVTVTSASASSIPPYYSVLNIQRKTSLSAPVGSTEINGNYPSLPTALLTEGLSNPISIVDLTPEFSAVFNDLDTGQTGNYYQIEVNTASDFTGTVMWDSAIQPMTATAIGARSPDISYNGTTLSTNGVTYYWRIKFGDNLGYISDWSSTANFRMGNPPNIPSSVYIEGTSNPSKVTDLTPEFSAVFSDTDSTDTGVYYEIEVNTNSSFTGTVMWDSGKTSITAITNGSRSSDISYGDTDLSLNGVTYYLRIRFWDQTDLVSSWSSVANFTMSGPPFAPDDLLVDGKTNPTIIDGLTPIFTAVYEDPNSDNCSAYEIEVNTNSGFTGTVMWDTGKQSTTITSGERSPNYTYSGTTLTGSSHIVYYWRIRFWDSDDNVSEWSITSYFTDLSSHLYLDGMQLDGLQID